MKNARHMATCFLLTAVLLAGCGQEAATDTDSAVQTEAVETVATESEEDVSTYTAQTDSDMFTDRDLDSTYDESESVLIQLDGDSASASSDSVQISGSTVTITEEATYIVSGTLSDGMIVVNASDSDKVRIVLNGVDINSETSAALYILEADKVFVTLAEGTENTLSNGGTFTAIDENNIDGAVFSKQDLTMNGSGSLTVTSPAGHGIVCKDDLVITGGTYTISCASHGLDANDSIRITGDVTLNLETGKDGLHAENDDDSSLGFVYISEGSFSIQAEGDGISAGSYLQIEGGDFSITAGGGSENGSNESSDYWGNFPGGVMGQVADGQSDTEDDSSTSMKGLKAGTVLLISDGSFVIDSADDGVHSNDSMTINGGNFEIASGDDAFHADEYLTVTSGTINISTCYEGLEALHLDIQGGDITLVATDDGLNAAGGADSSGTEGGRDGMFGGGWGSTNSDGTIVISGGTLYINASGDGIDANGTIEISGGYITIVGPSQGDTATLDYDVSAVITGGVFIGTGASNMAQTFSESGQGVISVSTGSQEAGTTITVSDSDGNIILEYTPELAFQVFIFSSEDVVSGETYTITAGSASGEIEAG